MKNKETQAEDNDNIFFEPLTLDKDEVLENGDIEIQFVPEYNELVNEYRRDRKNHGVYLLQLEEVHFHKTGKFNTMSLVFIHVSGKKYYLDKMFLDRLTYKKSINVSYSLNHQLIELLGVSNSKEILEEEDYDGDVLEQALSKHIGKKIYLALSVKIDLADIGLFYDFKLMHAFNVQGQSLREQKHNILTMHDMYFRESLLTPLYSGRYLKEGGNRLELDKNVADMVALSNKQIGIEK